MKKRFIIGCVVLFSLQLFGQIDGDVIINEIGNGGTKKALYSGGDYIELLVLKPEGLKLASWFLTDLSSPGGTAKETEGRIKFSDEDGSIFNEVLPRGTYILICIGESGGNYGGSIQKEISKLKKGENKLVLFTESSPDHIEKTDGTISLTGKDNIALLSAWEKKAGVDIVTWDGATNWTGCEVTELPVDMLENGEIVYFKPSENNVSNNTNAQLWVSTSNQKEATPGQINKDVDELLFDIKK